jgi:DNA modification methylase
VHAPIHSSDDDAAFVATVEKALAAAERDQASAARQFIDVGRMLLERKEAGKRDGSIPHGEWKPWLKRNFPSRSYNRLGEYMRVAEAMKDDPDTKTRLSVFLPQGFDAVLNEVRKLQSKPKPKPEPAWFDVPLTGEPFYDIRQGDVRDLLADLPEVHCVITSPPYFNLITYGNSDRQIGHEPTVEAYIAGLVDLFKAIPLHPLGSIFVNLGDTRRDGALLNVPGRFCTAMQAAGFELIDAVIWAKSVAKADGETIGRVLPEPCTGRLNSTAYEPLFRFVKDGNAWTDTVAVQVARNNVAPQHYLPEDLMRTATSLNGRNLPNVWLVNRRNSFVHTKEHYGCFPPELVERPIAGFCPPFVNPDGSLPRRIVEQVEYDDGIGPRTFGKSEPAAGISGRHDVGVRYTPRRPAHMGGEQVAADAIPSIVCDPFCGVGTTGEVALKLGRSFVGIDLYEEYVETARRRCAEAKDYVRRTYGYAAVSEMIMNPPAPQQQDDVGGDNNVIDLSTARRLVRVAVGWDGVRVHASDGTTFYPARLFSGSSK